VFACVKDEPKIESKKGFARSVNSEMGSKKVEGKLMQIEWQDSVRERERERKRERESDRDMDLEEQKDINFEIKSKRSG
jgi:hypothetical protein